MHKVTFVFGCVVFLFACGACDLRPSHIITDEDQSFEGIEEIVVRGGALEVSYRGDDQMESVTLSAYLESSQPNLEGIVYRREGKRLEVFLPEENSPLSFWTGRTKGYIHLTGPKEILLDMDASSGKVEIANLSGGDLKFGVSSGKMVLQDIDCTTLTISCSSGKLDASRISGNVTLTVSSGLGLLQKVNGDVYFKGSSGSIEIREVSGTVSGEMSSGKVTVDNAKEMADLRVASGYMRVGDVGLGPQTRLSVSSGLLRVSVNRSLSDFNYDFTVGSGYLTIGDKSATEDLRIDNGSVYTIQGSVRSGKLELTAP